MKSITLGCDIARYGADSSAVIAVCDEVVLDCWIWHGSDTMETVGKISYLLQHIPSIALIDEIGVGAGVADRLKELGHPYFAVNVGESARDSDHFKNLRAELYWNLRERFQNGEIDLSRLERKHYDRLVGELTAIKFKYTSKGQIQIEAKEEMKERIGRSPDVADALMLAYARKPNQYGSLSSVGGVAQESRWGRANATVNQGGGYANELSAGGSRWRRK